MNDYQSERTFFSQSLKKEVEIVQQVANDAFCNSKIIAKQRIFEGKKIEVLYNYAPIGKLQFLVVSKEHRTNFSDLTSEEYVEASKIIQTLCAHYQKKGQNIAYIFHKSGKRAGQSVPHWHAHLIFSSSKIQELFGWIFTLKSMFIGITPLSDEELSKRVKELKTELVPLLT